MVLRPAVTLPIADLCLLAIVTALGRPFALGIVGDFQQRLPTTPISFHVAPGTGDFACSEVSEKIVAVFGATFAAPTPNLAAGTSGVRLTGAPALAVWCVWLGVWLFPA